MVIIGHFAIGLKVFGRGCGLFVLSTWIVLVWLLFGGRGFWLGGFLRAKQRTTVIVLNFRDLKGMRNQSI